MFLLLIILLRRRLQDYQPHLFQVLLLTEVEVVEVLLVTEVVQVLVVPKSDSFHHHRHHQH